MTKRLKSKSARGLVPRRIEFRDRSRPHAPAQTITVDIRRGAEVDADYAVGLVAARTPTRLADVKIVRVLRPDAGQWVPVDL